MNNTSNSDLFEQHVQMLLLGQKYPIHQCHSVIQMLHSWNPSSLEDIEHVHWCARKGVFNDITGIDENNPADVLIEYASGNFLGVSLKSTKINTTTLLCNPGLGPITSYLDTPIVSLFKMYEDNITSMFGLSSSRTERKKEIRSDPEFKKYVDGVGRSVFHTVLNDPYYGLKPKFEEKPLDDNKEHILDKWFNVNTKVPYVQISYHENSDNWSLQDPLDNKYVNALLDADELTWTTSGNSLLVSADSINILRMRIKFESQAFASSVKFAGSLE